MNNPNYLVLIHQVKGIKGFAKAFDTIDEAMNWGYKRISELESFECIEIKRLGDPHTYEGRVGRVILIINN